MQTSVAQASHSKLAKQGWKVTLEQVAAGQEKLFNQCAVTSQAALVVYPYAQKWMEAVPNPENWEESFTTGRAHASVTVDSARFYQSIWNSGSFSGRPPSNQ